jgi:hypothetical protein
MDDTQLCSSSTPKSEDLQGGVQLAKKYKDFLQPYTGTGPQLSWRKQEKKIPPLSDSKKQEIQAEFQKMHNTFLVPKKAKI